MARWRIAVWVGLVAVAAVFFYQVRGILLPFILAWLIAVLLEPVSNKLCKKGMSRGLAATTITVSFFVVSGVFLILTLPRVNAQVLEFQSSIQTLTSRLAQESASENFFVRWNPAVRTNPPSAVGWIDKVFAENSETLKKVGLPTSRRAFIDEYVEPRRDDITAIVQNFFNGFIKILGGAASQVFLLLFTPLFVFMFMSDMETFRSRWTSWIPPAFRHETVSIVSDISDVFRKYMRGVMTTIALYTLVMSVLFSVGGMPYSILLAILAGTLYLVPLLGPLTSALTIFVVTGFSGATGAWYGQFDSPWVFAMVLAGSFLVVSTIFDQLVYPRMVGRALDLHPLVSMFVVFSGGALFGLPGMLVSFPLAGSIKVVLARLLKVTSKPLIDGNALPAVPMRHR